MQLDATSGLNGVLGIEFVEVTEDGCVARVELDERHMQPYGIVHGGVYSALVEVTASMSAAVWAVGQGISGAVGVNNNTDFIKATRDGVLIATATPVHRGQSQQIWAVEVRDEESERLRARGQVRLVNISNPDTVGSA